MSSPFSPLLRPPSSLSFHLQLLPSISFSLHPLTVCSFVSSSVSTDSSVPLTFSPLLYFFLPSSRLALSVDQNGTLECASLSAIKETGLVNHTTAHSEGLSTHLLTKKGCVCVCVFLRRAHSREMKEREGQGQI